MEPSLDLTQIHRVPRSEDTRWDSFYRPSVVGALGWSSLHQDHGVVSQRRCRIDDEFAVEVFRHLGISQHLLLPPRCVFSLPFSFWGLPIAHRHL